MIYLLIAIIITVIVAAIVTVKTLKSINDDASGIASKNNAGAVTAPSDKNEENASKNKKSGGLFNFGNDKVVQTVQDFLPFDRIEDSMICLNDDRYRMMIEVNSMNYYLKTNEEQNVIEEQFSRHITGWDFPWCFYVQTREIDNRLIVENLEKEIASSTYEFPKLADYGKAYLKYIKELPVNLRSNLVKKKYIIIFCDDAAKMTELDSVERKEYAFDQLFDRANIVINNLKALGLSSHICKTNELAEVIYQSLNKRSGGAIDGILSGEFMSGMVEGREKEESEKFDNNKLNLLINEFANTLEVDVIEDRVSSDQEKAKARYVKARIRDFLDSLEEAPEVDTNDAQYIAENTPLGTTGKFNDENDENDDEEVYFEL